MARTTTMTVEEARINASPTKEFFIHMLTRDIPLSRAILDLVDNSVDGARRLRPDGRYAGLWVRIELSAEKFRIVDNCGGIPVDVARDYAFRFGRPKEAKGTPGSMGQFGVGMKRTFFRLGRHFIVSSNTFNSRFIVDVDVDEWLGDADAQDDWHFKFKQLETDIKVCEHDVGTAIEVDRLLPNVKETFALANFIGRLSEELSHAHALTLNSGLAITLNGIPTRHDPQQLCVSKNLKPAFIEKSYYPSLTLEGQRGKPVKVKLYAGVAERSLHDGGWYVFCNGRLILRADQTANTVWGDRHQMRAYHPDFAFFRGYAYFDSDDGSLLPWTTTKTGVDADSPVYKSVQQEMIEMTKPVLKFLSDLAKERATESKQHPLDDALKAASLQQVQSLTKRSCFVAPEPAQAPAGPKMQRIQYSKPAAEVERVKKRLRVKSFTAVGEETFDYYLKYECEEE